MTPTRPGVSVAAWTTPSGGGHSTDAVLLGSARAMLRAENVEEIVGVVVETVRDLGGQLTVPTGRESELPLDVTFGHGPPLVPCGDRDQLTRLQDVLPALIEDARVAVQRVQANERLRTSASVDALTGLSNRRTISRILARLVPGDTVVMIDLDRFKDANDEHGHEFGDAVLRSFGRALRVTVRAADVAGRLGGDEFVILLRETDVDLAVMALDRLGSVWRRMGVDEVTFCAGVAAVLEDETPGDTLRRADEALYRAKAAGRDRVAVT